MAVFPISPRPGCLSCGLPALIKDADSLPALPNAVENTQNINHFDSMPAAETRFTVPAGEVFLAMARLGNNPQRDNLRA